MGYCYNFFSNIPPTFKRVKSSLLKIPMEDYSALGIKKQIEGRQHLLLFMLFLFFSLSLSASSLTTNLLEENLKEFSFCTPKVTFKNTGCVTVNYSSTDGHRGQMVKGKTWSTNSRIGAKWTFTASNGFRKTWTVSSYSNSTNSINSGGCNTSRSCDGRATSLTFISNRGRQVHLRGNSICTSDLNFSHGFIRVNTSGRLGSMKIWVSGAARKDNIENIHPYDSKSFDLRPGNYTIKVSLFWENNGRGTKCSDRTFNFTIEDCTPKCPDGSPLKTPGSACNDFNPNTQNDRIQRDGCSCRGVVPTCPDGSPLKTPGSACNDFNPNTQNDRIQGDGCSCRGVVPTCPDGSPLKTPGSACNDFNPNTQNDRIQGDGCSCRGVVPTCPDGSPLKTPGSACNDFNPNTQNDRIQGDGCSCRGVVPTCPDGSPLKTPGSACNDFNPNTQNDRIQGDGCSCVGVVPTCPDGSPLKTPGSACNDFNPNTQNDRIQGDGCSCVGVVPTCPDGSPLKTPGSACNDFNPNTQNDRIQGDGCSCVGVVPTCPDGSPLKTPGSACNDFNPNTQNDRIQGDGCSCVGQQIPDPNISVPEVITINEENGTANVVISLSAPATKDVTVIYTTLNGSAVSGSDYTTQIGTATIPAGSISTTVTIPIINDATPEGIENFLFKISNAIGATIIREQTTINIIDTDVAQPNIVVNDVTVSEENGVANVLISLSAPAPAPITVNYTTTNGSAVNGTDYVTQTGTVTIPTGSTSATVSIPLINDATPENTESFQLTITNATGGIVTDPQGTITITDPDKVVLPTISINDITVNESAGSANLTVSLSAPSSTPVTFTYFTANGSAISGIDYITQSNTITIPAGSTTATIILPLVDDNNPESTENFVVNIGSVQGATIADNQGTVTILDSDKVALPTISINDITVDESAGTTNLTVSLSAPSSTPVTFTYFTANGSAISGTDYITQSNTITIPAGSTTATIILPIVDDNNPESTENFVVNLGAVQGATVADNQGTVTITDNDQITTMPTCNTVSIEAGNGTIVIRGLKGAPVTSLTIMNSQGASVYSCFNNCSGTETIPVVNDTYQVIVRYYNEAFAQICEKMQTVTISDGGNTGTNLPVTCGDVSINVVNGTLTMVGPASSNYNFLVYSVAELRDVSCRNACGNSFTLNNARGWYQVQVFTADWVELCTKLEIDAGPGNFTGTTSARIANTNEANTKAVTLQKEAIALEGTNMASTEAISNTATTMKSAQISISPNPVRDILSIKTTGFTGTTATLSLLSQVGQLVKQIEWTGESDNLQLDVQQLESGLYYLTTRLASGEILTEKIVITK